MESYETHNFILRRLNESENEVIPNTLDIAAELSMEHQTLDAALKSLNVDDYIQLRKHEIREIKLTEEGRNAAENGTNEVQVAKMIPADAPLEKKVIEAKFGKLAKVAINQGMKNKWFKASKTHVERLVSDDAIVDETQAALCGMLEHPAAEAYEKKAIQALEKRRLIKVAITKYYEVTKGINYHPEHVDLTSELTAEMLRDGSWKDQEFKRMNTNALGQQPEGGHLHPLLKVRSLFKEVLIELGFEEMCTDKFVESSFWNFDSLFQPQQHPARDAHDTFFLKDPATTETFPEDYLKRVKDVHENGGYGSRGYDYEWNINEAKKNILRTHTTAHSSQYLYKMAQEPVFRPRKYFSIDRVFRNETLDATHLAEFHQVEGLIIDKNIGLANLLGMFELFFKKIGIDKLKFKPAYNPYTEPSLEIFGYHPILKKWVEIGNSGVFRPEMLRPMGFDEDVTVIAWGLSLERPAMIYYGIDNIRDLFGHKVDLSKTRENKVCYMKSAE